MENERCNGYSNRETWAANLWIANDEGSCNYWNGAAEEIAEDAKDKDDAIYTLEKRLQEEHEEGMPELTNGIYSDLLAGALGRVNWMEIAEGLLEDFRRRAANRG